MDGISAVVGRIAQIESRIAALAPPPVGLSISAQAAVADATYATAAGAPATTGTSFAAALADAVQTTPGLGPLAPTTGLDGSLGVRNPAGVPLELVQYGNGRIPTHALSEVGQTGQRLWQPAARALESLIASAAQDGVSIGITDAYRSYESQVDVAARKGLYKEGGLAAVPGTSNHGWGMAVDLRLDGNAQAWMQSNGAKFGFVNDVPREPWHWNYRG